MESDGVVIVAGLGEVGRPLLEILSQPEAEKPVKKLKAAKH